MDSELAVLVASGATTLVSLMVTDSWTHARELVGRYLPRTGADPGTFDDLQDARALLLAADGTERERTVREISRRYGARLHRLAEAGDGSDEALRALLTSLLQLSASATGTWRTVDNRISGGVQHGPVVQSGTVAGLPFHVDHVDRQYHQCRQGIAHSCARSTPSCRGSDDPGVVGNASRPPRGSRAA